MKMNFLKLLMTTSALALAISTSTHVSYAMETPQNQSAEEQFVKYIMQNDNSYGGMFLYMSYVNIKAEIKKLSQSPQVNNTDLATFYAKYNNMLAKIILLLNSTEDKDQNKRDNINNFLNNKENPESENIYTKQFRNALLAIQKQYNDLIKKGTEHKNIKVKSVEELKKYFETEIENQKNSNDISLDHRKQSGNNNQNPNDNNDNTNNNIDLKLSGDYDLKTPPPSPTNHNDSSFNTPKPRKINPEDNENNKSPDNPIDAYKVLSPVNNNNPKWKEDGIQTLPNAGLAEMNKILSKRNNKLNDVRNDNLNSEVSNLDPGNQKPHNPVQPQVPSMSSFKTSLDTIPEGQDVDFNNIKADNQVQPQAPSTIINEPSQTNAGVNNVSQTPQAFIPAPPRQPTREDFMSEYPNFLNNLSKIMFEKFNKYMTKNGIDTSIQDSDNKEKAIIDRANLMMSIIDSTSLTNEEILAAAYPYQRLMANFIENSEDSAKKLTPEEKIDNVKYLVFYLQIANGILQPKDPLQAIAKEDIFTKFTNKYKITLDVIPYEKQREILNTVTTANAAWKKIFPPKK